MNPFRNEPCATIVDEELAAISQSVDELCRKEFPARLKNLAKDEFPSGLISMLAAQGYLGAMIPEQYGGFGYTMRQYLPVIERLAYHDGSVALIVAAHHSLAAAHILEAGTEEQKRRYLTQLAGGGAIGAWCLTEETSGSDAFGQMRTTLRPAGERWMLNGAKTFITNGTKAGIYVVNARMRLSDGAESIAACIVEKAGSGSRIVAEPLGEKMGMHRTDTATVRFEEVPVETENILGNPSDGGKSTRNVLYRGRIGISALALGIAANSFDAAAAFARERGVSGGKLIEKQNARFVLADMFLKWWNGWQAIMAAARLADGGSRFDAQSCAVKLRITDDAVWICDEAIQMLAGNGYMLGHRVAENYGDVRLTKIGEGTSEIQKETIANRLFGKTGEKTG